MTPTITCPSCGEETPLTTVFCRSCGARLDLSQITAADLAQKRPGAVTIFLRLLRAVLLVGLLVALLLLLWPISPGGARGGRMQAESMTAKLTALNSALRNGLEREVVVEEREANAYLTATARSGAQSGGRQLALSEVNLTFTPQIITVVIVGQWGPVPVTYEVRGRPARVEDTYTFEVQSARFGHLPLPGPARNLVVRRMAASFAGLTDEQEVLNGLSDLKLGTGKALAVVGKGK